jgi:hypothetical protein
MSKVRGMKVTLSAIINSDPIDSMFGDFVTPKKATILAFHTGTLVEAEDGGLYLIPMGDWFRSIYNNKPMAQVDDFNELQDLGLTVIKDKVVRHGQEVRGKDNVSVAKADEAVAADNSEAKDS